ncbi:hypothetical protein C0J52_12194 [Blattella germanica]|nr:hypothetical protein C0J52_12194 [Blattella germanica]
MKVVHAALTSLRLIDQKWKQRSLTQLYDSKLIVYKLWKWMLKKKKQIYEPTCSYFIKKI